MTESEMLTLSDVADVLWIGGAVIPATGLVLTLVLREEIRGVTATAGCGPSGCGVALKGRF